MRIVIIGLGGIGTLVSETIIRYCSYEDKIEDPEFVLIDGDSYELKNRNRQDFSKFGNKASVKFNEFNTKYGHINFKFVNKYLTKDNVYLHIKENDIILMGVDNNATRKLVSDYCKLLKTVYLISGGNNYTTVTVQNYIRKNGVDISPALDDYHDEVRFHIDKNPDELSCEELQESSSPQTIFANDMAALIMKASFYNITNAIIKDDFMDFKLSEIRGDVETLKIVPSYFAPLNN